MTNKEYVDAERKKGKTTEEIYDVIDPREAEPKELTAEEQVKAIKEKYNNKLDELRAAESDEDKIARKMYYTSVVTAQALLDIAVKHPETKARMLDIVSNELTPMFASRGDMAVCFKNDAYSRFRVQDAEITR